MATLTVQPSAKDNHVYERAGYQGYNYGAEVYLWGYNRTTRAARPLLEFDISGLPGGATLSAATLWLYYWDYQVTDPNGVTIWAYKQTRTDWVEGTGTGAAPGSDGADWLEYKPGTVWTAAGGDYVTTSPSGGSTTFPASYGWMSWNVLAIVQDAYDGSIATELLVKFADETLSSGYSLVSFYSNNYSGDTDLCPKLVIDYDVVVVAGFSKGFIIG